MIGTSRSDSQTVTVAAPGARAAACSGPLKRALDLALCVPGLIALALALPFVALAIRVDSRGPVFYTQVRLGLDGKPFRIYKFRTMVCHAETGERWTMADDDRITRVGRVLRPIHLDELPQVINVLRGEMSFVGPRPESAAVMEMLSGLEPRYHQRLCVRPGMAGLAHVRQGYVSTVEGAMRRLEYDLEYVENWSVWLDLWILARSTTLLLRLRRR